MDKIFDHILRNFSLTIKRAIMRAIVICILGFSTLACSSFYKCVEGEGEIISRSLSINQFVNIELACSADVEIIQGSVQSVTISTQENLVDLLNTAVTQGEWKIDFTENICTDMPIKISITLPEYERIEINGSGNINSKGMIKGKELETEIEGSGNITLLLEMKKLTTIIDGSGDVVYSGSAKEHSISIDGSGDIRAQDLETSECIIEVDGSGDSFVYVTDRLEIEIDGSGDVTYSGNPESIKSDIHGSGSIKQK